MLNVLSSHDREALGKDLFRIQRIRPGKILGASETGDLAFGPLSVIDHATLGEGALVRMHEHVNDEILSYLWQGTMVHQDTTGDQVELSARRFMMMNAGRGFSHEESVPDGNVEMLQIFVRPGAPDQEPRVQFFEPPPPPVGHESAWRAIAGPPGHGAPLQFRQRVWVFDAALREGQEIEGLRIVEAGLSPWLYVLDGSIAHGKTSLGKGSAITWGSGEAQRFRAESDAALVGFLVDLSATSSRAGTISGR